MALPPQGLTRQDYHQLAKSLQARIDAAQRDGRDDPEALQSLQDLNAAYGRNPRFEPLQATDTAESPFEGTPEDAGIAARQQQDGADAQSETSIQLQRLAEKATLAQRLLELSLLLKQALEKLGITLPLAQQQESSAILTPAQMLAAQQEEARLQQMAVDAFDAMEALRSSREHELAAVKERLSATTALKDATDLCLRINQSVQAVADARAQAMRQADMLAGVEENSQKVMASAATQAEALRVILFNQCHQGWLARIPIVGREWANKLAEQQVDRHITAITERLAQPEKFRNAVSEFHAAEARSGRRATAATPVEVYLAQAGLSRSQQDLTGQSVAAFARSATQLREQGDRALDPEVRARAVAFIRAPFTVNAHLEASRAAQTQYQQLAKGDDLTALVDFQARCPASRGTLDAALKSSRALLDKTAQQPEKWQGAMNGFSEQTLQAIRNIQEGNLAALGAQLRTSAFRQNLTRETAELKQKTTALGARTSELQAEATARYDALLQLRERTQGFFNRVAGFFNLDQSGNVQRIGNREALETLLDAGKAEVLATPDRAQGPVFAVRERLEDGLKGIASAVQQLPEAAANNIAAFARNFALVNSGR